MVLCGSCRNERHGTTVGGWERTGLPSDSLLEQMDLAMLSYASADSVGVLAREYMARLTAEDERLEYSYRIPYVKGTALFMAGDFERGDSLRAVGIAMCDSAQHQQDYALMQLGREQPGESADAVSEYVRLSASLEGFLRNGDRVNAATRAVQLSGLFCEADLASKGLGYALMADSLLESAGLASLRNTYRINLASAWACAGKKGEAEKILEEVRRSPYFVSDPTMRGILAFNKSEITGESSDLEEAWREIKDREELARFQGLVAAAWINKGVPGVTDSLRRALDGAYDYAYRPEEELAIAEARVREAMPWDGDSVVSAYLQQSRDYISGYKGGKLAALALQAEMRDLDEAKERQIRERNIALGVAVGGLLLVIFCVVGYFRKRLSDAERLAMLQTIEAKSAGGERVVPAAEGHDSDSAFLSEFVRMYPRVSKTGRKIALLIRGGKDVAEVASALNIRKESVLQARWRLRTQMDLKPEQDLDMAILNFPLGQRARPSAAPEDGEEED